MKATFTIGQLATGKYKVLYLGDDILEALKPYQTAPKDVVKVAVWRKGNLYRKRSVTAETVTIVSQAAVAPEPQKPS